jgi:tetratricopeptide (TPR) repeat protein
MAIQPFRLIPFLALLLCTAAVPAHEGSHGEAEDLGEARVLGTLSFPTSTTNAEAQEAFIRGMLLLHLFEYEFALTHFQQAQALDPDFAMAYWGEAMTWNHPIWDQQERERARATLSRLAPTAEGRAAKAGTARERDFLQSLEILYGDGTKAARDAAYANHLGRMVQRYPGDHEVMLFHALAIMGVGAGVRDIPAYMEAAALAQQVFYANREHPGAAHYLIHAVDDPVHAPLGLEAARALAVMAPDAGHSLHMTSHIFTALGMWDDVVVANVEAARVSNEMAMERGRAPRSWGHYNFWLLYGLLQQGRHDEARKLLDAAYTETIGGEPAPVPALELDPDRSQVGSVVQMWARYLIETGGANAEDLLAWKFPLGEAFDPRLTYHFVQALFADEAGRQDEHLAAFLTLQQALVERVAAQPRQPPAALLYLQRLDVMALELRAVQAQLQGQREAMLAHAREASRLEGDMPFSFGPPFVDLPAAQLLGDLLLSEERYDEAAEAFETQLERSRRRAQALRGLAAAEQGRGNDRAASFARARYEQTRYRR